MPHRENRDMTEATPMGPNLAYENYLDGALVVTGAYVLFFCQMSQLARRRADLQCLVPSVGHCVTQGR